MVSPGLLPRTPEVQNTGEAQRGPPILQAVHEVQAAAVAAGENFQISNGCNSSILFEQNFNVFYVFLSLRMLTAYIRNG